MEVEEAIEQLIEAEAVIEKLQKELTGTQEMLAYVLDAVVEPVYVSKKRMQEGLPPGTGISVLDDQKAGEFIFSLEIRDAG